MNKNKIHPMTIIRHVIQLIAFLLIPGLFASTLNALKSLMTMIVTGTFSLSSFVTIIVLLCITMIPTLLFGRFFCGFFVVLGQCRISYGRSLKEHSKSERSYHKELMKVSNMSNGSCY